MNGTFGVGKTTTGRAICERSTRWRHFDPEFVGYMIRDNLPDYAVADFQDLPPWRVLVPMVMREVQRFTRSDLVAVQTVLVEEYWNELHAALIADGSSVFHVVLDCEDQVLRQRIAADEDLPDGIDWRMGRLDDYLRAKDWMFASADLVVDTTRLTAADVATTILAAVDDADAAE